MSILNFFSYVKHTNFDIYIFRGGILCNRPTQSNTMWQTWKEKTCVCFFCSLLFGLCNKRNCRKIYLIKVFAQVAKCKWTKHFRFLFLKTLLSHLIFSLHFKIICYFVVLFYFANLCCYTQNTNKFLRVTKRKKDIRSPAYWSNLT